MWITALLLFALGSRISHECYSRNEFHDQKWIYSPLRGYPFSTMIPSPCLWRAAVTTFACTPEWELLISPLPYIWVLQRENPRFALERSPGAPDIRQTDGQFSRESCNKSHCDSLWPGHFHRYLTQEIHYWSEILSSSPIGDDLWQSLSKQKYLHFLWEVTSKPQSQ